jgi:hypothetical protein
MPTESRIVSIDSARVRGGNRPVLVAVSWAYHPWSDQTFTRLLTTKHSRQFVEYSRGLLAYFSVQLRSVGEATATCGLIHIVS